MTDPSRFSDHNTGIDAPESLPRSDSEAKEWQTANRDFWESNPMRYDWHESVQPEEFSELFYEEIDKRFFADVSEYMPWDRRPFDNLIDFDSLKDQRVLEIGVGNGSHAQLLAASAGSYTGIDLTEYAVKSTSTRLRLRGIEATVQRMDAENLSFPDASFDFVWSWGVIHHSSDTRAILRQIHRVLKPGGKAVIMVYHRGWWNYYVLGGLVHGLVRGELLKTRSLFKTVQRQTDGALARYYAQNTWRSLVADKFDVDYTTITGSKTDVFPIPGGKVKSALMGSVPSRFTRFMTDQCQMGGFLISQIVKR